MFRSLLALGFVTTLVSLFSGCGDAVDPAVLAQRTKYMLADEPAGALGVLAVRQQLDGDHEGHIHQTESGSTEQQPEQAPASNDEKPQTPEHAEKDEHHQNHEHDGHDHGHHLVGESSEEVAVVGRIGGMLNPWSEGFAGFWIVDDTTQASGDHQGHDHTAHDDPGHDPDTCPFCKKGKDNPQALAIVQFEDEQGKILGIDARKLFNISRNQTVVIRGSTSFDDLGNLVISASGLYIRE